MALTDRFLTTVSQHSRLIIAVMLVFSLLIGGGMGLVDDDTSMEQFETDSPELEKLDYIEQNFGVEDDNTTTAQIVIREDNALTRESLIETLELRQAFEQNRTINSSLADPPVNDLALFIARTAMVDDRLDELDTNSEALANDSEQLAADSDALQERQAAFEADQAELDERIEFLQSALEETAGIQQQYERGALTEMEAEAAIQDSWTAAQSDATLTSEQNATFRGVGADVREVASLEFERNTTIETGPTEITDDPADQEILRAALNETVGLQTAYEGADSDEERAAINETIEETWEEAATNAVLDDQQEATFRDLGQTVRTTTTSIVDIGPMPALFEAGTTEVLSDDIADLEDRGEQLDADGTEIEDRQQELADRGDNLEADYEAVGEIDPTPAEAIEYLEAMSQDEYDTHLSETLDDDADSGLFVFLPTDYEPGSTQADARMLFVTQETTVATGMEGEAAVGIVESELAMQSIVQDRFDDGFVFGAGIITDEMDRSLEDSLTIVLPLALLFVTLVLIVAYRDVLDILLGLLGIVLVLVWTFGFLGWSGMPFTIIMIAVPVLLVGLSVDYAIHVFMRHREQRDAGHGSTRRAMAVALSGVGIALVWVTATAIIGFLSNLVSPIDPIREFGLAAAFGIASALVIFGVFVPALKLETDAFLEARGFDRRKRAFGTEGGFFTRFLSFGQRAAGRVPWAVVIVAVLLTTGGAVGASQVDTTFDQEDFLADDPPDWTKNLPEPFATGEYGAKANMDYVNDHFLRQDTQGHVLVEGDVDDDRMLLRVADAESTAADQDSTIILSDGSPDIESPLSTMQSVATENASFNETFTDADTTGDEIPDENVTGVYDALFEADEDAAREVIHRTDDGDYEAVQLVISVSGGATGGEVTTDMRTVADSIDGDGIEATATGQLVVFYIIESELFETVLQSLLITLVAVFAFLMLGYRWMHRSATLGAVTLLPIVFAVAWILGTMYLLGIPFNVMTGTITSLTVGLGIAYNIHMSERYMLERRRGRDVSEALRIAVTGTGGALLGSAATTIGGFGVLMFAILPPLQQFGLITGLTILYAFLGSVFVLPSFLVLWTRYLGPPGLGRTDEADTIEPAAGGSD